MSGMNTLGENVMRAPWVASRTAAARDHELVDRGRQQRVDVARRVDGRGHGPEATRRQNDSGRVMCSTASPSAAPAAPAPQPPENAASVISRRCVINHRPSTGANSSR